MAFFYPFVVLLWFDFTFSTSWLAVRRAGGNCFLGLYVVEKSWHVSRHNGICTFASFCFLLPYFIPFGCDICWSWWFAVLIPFSSNCCIFLFGFEILRFLRWLRCLFARYFPSSFGAGEFTFVCVVQFAYLPKSAFYFSNIVLTGQHSLIKGNIISVCLRCLCGMHAKYQNIGVRRYLPSLKKYTLSFVALYLPLYRMFLRSVSSVYHGIE